MFFTSTMGYFLNEVNDVVTVLNDCSMKLSIAYPIRFSGRQ